ncbi:MAG: peptide/nickel transport system substrate-binding protein [Gaiellales bacterium]|nr:peptide/nickel transport system substrate-binding protein [Gaiellales bacterium]
MRRILTSVAVLALALAAGCGSGNSSSGGSGGAPVNGGVLRGGIPDNPDHLDTGISFAVEGWELLEATNNGLLTFKKAGGGQQSVILPDIASAMPTVSADGRTYSFHVRPNVMFSPPVSRAVRPSDFQYSIERLFHVGSPGVGFYTDIVGANAYAAHKAAHISGIVANDAAMTITFHLVKPDGAFLDDLAIPFAFAVPKGTPYKDISTDPAWRVATGPYMVSSYVPRQQIVLTRNPNFKQWTPASPKGHVNEVDITIGITPEQAVNETIAGQLDWYMEAVPADRFTALRKQYPKQTFLYPRNNVTYFSMNSRKPPFDKLAVRQAVNYAIDRNALVKIFGGQGIPSETVLPPGFGSSYQEHHLYPHNVAKAKQLIASAGATGAPVQVWTTNAAPAPAASQYLASVLKQIGLNVTGVKQVDDSVYWDTLLTQAGDPQIAFNHFDQDFPEGEDFIDTTLNGEHIVNVGNNDVSNTNDPTLNAMIDRTKLMPLGDARNAQWAKIDAYFMQHDAGWAPFLHLEQATFVSARLHGLIFTGSYFELIPELWLSK